MMKSGTNTAETRRIGGRRGAGPAGRTRGTSLVEVLVVLVILLIGVFTIIRVFPIGLTGLRQAENRTLATRLATQMLEQVRGDEASLPQGVLFTYLDTRTSPPRLVPVLGEDPDDLAGYPKDNPNPYFTDINKFRTIVGEPVKIPLPTTGVYGSGSLYTLKFGPIFMHPFVGERNRVPSGLDQQGLFDSYLRVYGAPLRGTNVEAEDVNPQRAAGFLRGPQTYLIDYGSDNDPARIMLVPPRTVPGRDNTRYYRLTFSYERGDQVRSSGVTTIAVPPTADGQPVWQTIPDPENPSQPAQNLLEGSETINREFTRLPVTGGGSDWDEDDPYQFKLLSDNIAGATGNEVYANVGILAFNPSGANYSERTPFGQQAFTALVDYSVFDWHILRDEREVPSVFLGAGGAVPVKLTLNFIKRVGDTEPDETLYKGLYRNAAARDQVDIQVFDLQGGSERYQADPTLLGTPLVGGDYAQRNGAARNADYWIDQDERGGSYRTGTIYVNPERVPAGTPLRILYKADGEWAVGLQKAFSAYEQARTDDNVLAAVPGNYDTFGKSGRFLRFHRADLNKSVVATVEYIVSGEVKRTQPTQMTIDAVDPALAQYAVVDVAKFLPRGQRAEFAQASDWRVVGQATGASVKARVIWKDNAATSNAWRIQDIDSYVTRTAGLF